MCSLGRGAPNFFARERVRGSGESTPGVNGHSAKKAKGRSADLERFTGEWPPGGARGLSCPPPCGHLGRRAARTRALAATDVATVAARSDDATYCWGSCCVVSGVRGQLANRRSGSWPPAPPRERLP